MPRFERTMHMYWAEFGHLVHDTMEIFGFGMRDCLIRSLYRNCIPPIRIAAHKRKGKIHAFSAWAAGLSSVLLAAAR